MNTLSFRGGSDILTPAPGEMVIHFGFSDPITAQYRVRDFWILDHGARLTITTHHHEFPAGIVMHNGSNDSYASRLLGESRAEEVIMPNCWKVHEGDRLVMGMPEEQSLTSVSFGKSAAVFWLKPDGSFPDPVEGMASPDNSDTRYVELLRRAAQEIALCPMPRSWAPEWEIDP